MISRHPLTRQCNTDCLNSQFDSLHRKHKVTKTSGDLSKSKEEKYSLVRRKVISNTIDYFVGSLGEFGVTSRLTQTVTADSLCTDSEFWCVIVGWGRCYQVRGSNCRMGFLVNVRKKDTLKNNCLFVTSTGFQPMTSVMPKAMLYQLLTQDHMSPTNRPLPNEWLHNPVGRALPWHRRGHGIKSR